MQHLGAGSHGSRYNSQNPKEILDLSQENEKFTIQKKSLDAHVDLLSKCRSLGVNDYLSMDWKENNIYMVRV